MITKPYVGVTGVTTSWEVDNVIREFYEAGYTNNSFHLPMLGYLVSYKTLKGRETSNRRYLKFRDLRDLVARASDRAFPMIHYNSRETSTLAQQVEEIFYNLYNDNLCRALQLNIPWPDPKQIGVIKDKFPDIKIVFQASKNILESLSSNKITSKLVDYDEIIEYVLIDPSIGNGLEFNLKDSLRLYEDIKLKFPGLIIGFAGGLNGENVSKRLKMITEKLKTANFSIDAEGGLRDKLSEEYGDDVLNIEKVRRYLRQASSILN